MKKIWTLIFGFIFLTSAQAQFIKCGQKPYETYLEKTYGVRPIQPTEAHNSSVRSGIIYEIPVVVHVLYNTPEENLSDELIRDQIKVLNEDFRRMNADASATRDVFKGVAADAQIQFYLAEVDPEGRPTNGITRTQTSKTSFVDFELDPLLLFQAALLCGLDLSNPDPTEEQIICITEFLAQNGLNFEDILSQVDNIKYSDKGGQDPWDQKRYLNIWVGDMSINLLGDEMPFLLGFAYPPVGAPLFPEGSLPEGYEKNDGVVIHYQAFGRNNPQSGTLQATNSSGRTCVHEVGHYLGLRHVWGDGDCSMDDGIADTPNMGEESQVETFNNCTELHTKNTCNDGNGDLPDMIENYMDYSPESCQNIFTQGQVNMMRAMLEGPRAELIGLNSSVHDGHLQQQVIVQPNPANGIVHFTNISNISSIRLFDLAGKNVLTVDQIAQLDVSNLEQGMYFYSVQNESKIFTGKLMIKQ